MNQGPVSRNHHFVPQFLQSLFLAEGSKSLWRYPLDGGPPTSKRPEKLLFRIRRHIAPDHLLVPGERPDELEHIFGSNESKAAQVIKNWQQPGRLIKEEEKAPVALFVASLVARVPSAEEKVRGPIDEWLGRLTSLEQVADVVGFGHEEFKKLEQARPEHAKNAIATILRNFQEPYMRMIIALKASLTFAVPILMRSKWTLLEAGEASDFILSDNPAFYMGGPDLLYCPFARKLCLCIADNFDGVGSSVDRQLVDDDFVVRTNRLAIGTADQWVVSHQSSKRLRELILSVKEAPESVQ